MAEDGGAVVLLVAQLQAEAVGQKRIAPRGIYDEFRPPLRLPAIVSPRGDERIARIELDAGHLAFFEGLRAFPDGVAEKNVVEIRTAHLVGRGVGLVPCIRETEHDRLAVPGRHEFDAILGHPDFFDFIGDAQLLEERHVERQQGFTDMEPRMPGLFQHHYIAPPFGEQGGDRRTRRAAANHEHITASLGFPVHGEGIRHGSISRLVCGVGFPARTAYSMTARQ